MLNWFSTSQENTSGSAPSEQVGLISPVGLTTSRLSSLSGISEGSNVSLQLLKQRLNISSGAPTSKERAQEIIKRLGEFEETRALDEEEAKISLLSNSGWGRYAWILIWWFFATGSQGFPTFPSMRFEILAEQTC